MALFYLEATMVCLAATIAWFLVWTMRDSRRSRTTPGTVGLTVTLAFLMDWIMVLRQSPSV